jgi:WD40 repeat protein
MLFMVDSASEVLAGLKNVHIVGSLVKGVGEVFVNFDRKPEQDDFDVLAFDAAGDLFAAADEAGKVAVYEFRPPNYPEHAYAIIERPTEHLGPRPLALSFSPTRQWLAAVRGNQLVVWPLQTLGFPRQIEALVSAQAGVTAALAFNPAGDLLAVGTSDRWQIWDVANKKLLIDEITQTPIYAVTFSPDGRLFAVGDANGVVQVWEVPSK